MIGALAFVFGSVVGSFLNVCIVRLPREESIVMPHSHCLGCKRPIPWYDNIPLLSFLLLKGRCRFCKKLISKRYWVVELLTAGIFLWFYLIFGLTEQSLIYAAWGAALIVVSFIDLEHQIIPDVISLGGLAAALVLSFLVPALHASENRWLSLWESALGALVGGGSIYGIGLLGNFFFRKESMGGGDVKLLAMVGAVLGWKLVLVAFFVAPFFGSVVGLILKFRKGVEVIPYGPFLSLGSVIALMWGRDILNFLGFSLYF